MQRGRVESKTRRAGVALREYPDVRSSRPGAHTEVTYPRRRVVVARTMASPSSKPTDPADGSGISANDNEDAAPAPNGRAAWPVWNADVTVRIAEVAQSASPSRRPGIVSRPPPPPDPGSLLLDSLALDYESKHRYVNPDASSAEAEIGRGGIGRVCLLIDQHLGREVALKELLYDVNEAQPTEATLRLLAEARITGQLEHPNIVPVYDIGRRNDGRLYYTMRVIRGETLADALTRAETLGQRLELLPHVARACNAIAYAHSRGIIHRDIKPDNIMIGEFGETVVLDWGIAKLRDTPDSRQRIAPRGIAQLSSTSVGELVGTPLYMSPEQALGEPDLDETTDVWSLGVLLYVVLSGRLPFGGDDFATVRTKIVRGKPKQLRHLEPSLPVELIAIAERALARDKQQRYPNAKLLAADLDAYMSGARVLAHQYSVLDLVRRFAKRHRAASWVALLGAAALLVVAGVLQRRILVERDRAVAAEKVALEKEHLARSSLAEFYADRAQTAMQRGALTEALIHAARSVSASETYRARGLVVALTDQEMWLPSGARAALPPEPLSMRRLHWEAGPTVTVTAPTGEVFTFYAQDTLSRATLTPDGHLVALGGRTGSVTLWWPDVQRTVALEGHRGSVVALSLSEDGSMLASSGLDRSVHLWKVNDGEPLLHASVDLGQATDLRFDASASRLFLATHEHELIELDVTDPNRVRRLTTDGQPIASIVTASATELSAHVGDRELSWRKRVPDINPVFVHPSNVLAVEHLAGGQVAFAGLTRDGVCIWDMRQPHCLTKLPIQSEQVRALSFAPATQRLAVGMSNGDIMVWDARTWLPERALTGHRGAIRALQFLPDGVGLVSASLDGGVFAWDTATGSRRWQTSSGNGIHDLTLDPRDLTTWSATRGGELEQRRGDGSFVRTARVSSEWLLAAALSPLHKALFAASGDGNVHWVDEGTLALVRSRRAHTGRVLCAEVSPDQQLLATSGEDGLVMIWRAATLEPVAQLIHHKGPVRALRFSPNGAHLVSAGDDRNVRVWSLSQLLTPGQALLATVTESFSLPPTLPTPSPTSFQ